MNRAIPLISILIFLSCQEEKRVHEPVIPELVKKEQITVSEIPENHYNILNGFAAHGYKAKTGPLKLNFKKSYEEAAQYLLAWKHSLLITGYDGSVKMITNDDGETLWTWKTGSSVYTPPVIYGDKVYIFTSDKYLTVLSAYEGFLLDEIYTEQRISGGPVMSEEEIFLLREDGNMEIRSLEDLSEIRSVRTSLKPDASLILYRDTVFLSDREGTLEGVDLFEDRVTFRDKAMSQKRGASRISARNGILYRTGIKGYIEAWSVSPWTLLWEKDISSPFLSGVTLGKTTSYAGSVAGEILALKNTDGELLWSLDTEKEIIYEPLLTLLTLYVSGGDTLFAIDPDRRVIIDEYTHSSRILSRPVLLDGEIWFTDGKNVICLSEDAPEKAAPEVEYIEILADGQEHSIPVSEEEVLFRFVPEESTMYNIISPTMEEVAVEITILSEAGYVYGDNMGYDGFTRGFQFDYTAGEVYIIRCKPVASQAENFIIMMK